MDNTKIQWTQATWNPTRGCSRVNSECDNCYAMRQAHRSSGAAGAYEGLTTIRRGKVDWTGSARFIPELLSQPLRWKRPRRIFVNSMSDLFHESLADQEIAAVFGVMAACPRHTFQILTKRPERMRQWFDTFRDHVADNYESDLTTALVVAGAHELGDGSDEDRDRHVEALGDLIRDGWARSGNDGGTVWNTPWPLPNVHLGVSCGTQKSADEFIPELLKTPAAVRFISAEPLLGSIDLGRFLRCCPSCGSPRVDAIAAGCGYCDGGGFTKGLHWVIVGGESGPGARMCELEHVESIVAQCRAAGIAVFVKQLGSLPVRAAEPTGNFRTNSKTGKRQFELKIDKLPLRDKKGGDMSEWSEHLRVREFPNAK